MIEICFGRIESIMLKGASAGFQHFLPCPRCFQKLSFSGSLKVGILHVSLWMFILIVKVLLIFFKTFSFKTATSSIAY